MVKDKCVNYFGYGANSSQEMVQTIVGRRPKGHAASLDNYQLCIQTWKELPQLVKKILSKQTLPWGPDFTSYAIKKGPGTVKGMAWEITRAERKLIKSWEIVGVWFQQKRVRIKDTKGKIVIAETEILMRGERANKVVSGLRYPKFLQSKERMLKCAKVERRDFISGKSVKARNLLMKRLMVA